MFTTPTKPQPVRNQIVFGDILAARNSPVYSVFEQPRKIPLVGTGFGSAECSPFPRLECGNQLFTPRIGA